MSKRKVEEANGSTLANGSGSEQTRKDKKRKLKVGAQTLQKSPDLDQGISKDESEEKKRLRKEKKKEKKRREALENDQIAKIESEATSLDETEAKRARKEARKAEKKRLKALNQNDKATAGAADTDVVKDGNGTLDRKTANEDSVTSTTREIKYKEDAALKSLPQNNIDSYLKENHITITDAGTDSTLRPILSFDHLPSTALPHPSIFASFQKPTPIQSAAWPFLLSGRDVVGIAETGSGKTLAFGVPCIRHISTLPLNSKQWKGGAARAVVVSPTRELAVQIFEQFEKIAKPAGLQVVCVYGGVPKDPQRLALRTAHIVVATPGRLNDLLEEGSADISNVSYVVLDEADRMLDKGFEQEIRKIISSTLPSGNILGSSQPERTRQTLMFTATWPPSVRELAASFMQTPVRINIGEDNPTGELRANARIKQVVEVVDPRAKEQRILQLLKQHQSGKKSKDRILVFCLYKKEAVRVENFLAQRGLKVAGIHGDLSQERRTKSLESFKAGETPLLVATDVAARGLDIPNVKVVLNVTFPLTAEDYVHRIGRTGRAGAEGLAITLFTEHDKAQSGALINVLKAANQPVPEELLKFGTTVKRKQHDSYGAFYKEGTGKKAEKIKFDD